MDRDTPNYKSRQTRPDDLLPCPLCGAAAFLDEWELDGHRFVSVECGNEKCGLRLCHQDPGKKAGNDAESMKRRWNRRISVPAAGAAGAAAAKGTDNGNNTTTKPNGKRRKHGQKANGKGAADTIH